MKIQAVDATYNLKFTSFTNSEDKLLSAVIIRDHLSSADQPGTEPGGGL